MAVAIMLFYIEFYINRFSTDGSDASRASIAWPLPSTRVIAQSIDVEV